MTDDNQDLYDDDLDDVEIIEEYDDETAATGFGGTEFAIGLIVGVALGAVVALLAAPQAGVRTRRDLGRKARRIRHDVEDRWDHAQRDLQRNVRRGKRKIRGKVEKAAKKTRKAVKRLA